MEFFPRQTHIDFMGMRKHTALLSIGMGLFFLLGLWVKGLHFGLDFTGGTQIELRYQRPLSVERIRTQLAASGFSGIKVTQYGTTRDILVRIANRSDMSHEELGEAVWQVLAKEAPEGIELRRTEFIGSEVGDHLAEQGVLAVLVSLFAMLIYIAFRFDYRFGISATVALLHDPIMILGTFAYLQIEFDLASLAAILAVIGYSLNDTIVVYDRVRENFRKVRKGTSLEIMNLSINQTLSRTIMTSVLTLLVVIALYLFGGETLKGFSIALIIGIVVGTYSSIFIAGSLALTLGLSRKDLVVAPRKVVDEMP